MLLRMGKAIASSEITPKDVAREFAANRRQFLAGLGAMGAAAMLPGSAFAADKLNAPQGKYTVNETLTPQAKA